MTGAEGRRATVSRCLLAGGLTWLVSGSVAGCQREPLAPEDYCEPDGTRPAVCCQLCPGLDPEQGHVTGVECEAPATPEHYRNISETWEQWSSRCDEGYAVAGHCSNGLSFVSWDQGLGGSEMRYFDASGAFVALETFSDLIDATCEGRWYWPKPVECANPTGTLSCGALLH